MIDPFTIIWLSLICGSSLFLAVYGIIRSDSAKLMFFPKTARSKEAGQRLVTNMVGVFTLLTTGLLATMLYLWV